MSEKEHVEALLATYLGGASLSRGQLATALLEVGSFVSDGDEVISQSHCCGRYCRLYGKNMCASFEHTDCHVHWAPLTNGIVPSVDSKQAAAGDCDHSRYGEMWQGVSSHVRYRRIRRKLQHHNDILLHLVLEHERTLWKETLLSRRVSVENGERVWWKEKSSRKRKVGGGRVGWTKWKEVWTDGRKECKKVISVEVGGKTNYRHRGQPHALPPVRSNKGLVRQWWVMEDGDEAGCTYEMVHTWYTCIRIIQVGPQRRSIKMYFRVSFHTYQIQPPSAECAAKLVRQGS